MGKTYKKFAGIFRSPRGHRNAVRNGCRKRKTPPDDWCDVRPDRQCYIPQKVAQELHKKGYDREYIIKRLKYRFKLANWQIRQIVPVRGIFYMDGAPCYCDECLKYADHWDLRRMEWTRRWWYTPRSDGVSGSTPD